MRRIKKRIALSFIFLLFLTLLIIAMPYVTKVAVKSSASSIDPDKGQVSYVEANLFDYEPSKRSVSEKFLLGETEYYTDTTLLLFNQESYGVNPKVKGVDNIPVLGEHNSWIEAYRYKVVQGLARSVLGTDGSFVLADKRVAVSGTDGVELFDVNDPKTFRGVYSFPLVNVGNGCLQYDSGKNHVEVTKEVDLFRNDTLLKMKRYDGTSSEGFMPFNKLNTSKGLDENGYYALSGKKNHFFGMRMDIPFVMSKGGKVTTNSGEEKDMIFTITGDGDMWVYVDDKLVLDLGGIHSQVEGSINFATGVVSTTGNHIDEDTGMYNKDVTTVLVNDTSIEKLSVGRHKLQVFYLERVGSVSNCKITVRVQEDQTPKETVAPEDNIVGPVS